MLLQKQITNKKILGFSASGLLLTFVAIIGSLILFSISFPQKNHKDIQTLDQASEPHLRSEKFTEVHAKLNEKKQKIETLRNLSVDHDTFLMAITLGCIIVGVIGILLCVFCAIRVFVYPVHPLVTVSESSLEIGNHKVYPVISYEVFKNYVGKPLVEKCCYCSSNFEENFSTQTHLNDDRLEEIVEENEDKNEEKDQQKKISSSSIQMTVCGHLVHHLCFHDFLEKEKTKKCPNCQESLTEEKLREWENKIGINFEKEYDEHFKNEVLEFTDERNEQTLESLSPELDSNPCCKKIIERADLSQNELYAVDIYSKIYKYHQGTDTDSLRQIFLQKENNFQEIAFDPQEHPQPQSDPKNNSQSQISPRKESTKQEKKEDPNKRFSQDTNDSEKGYTIIVARRRSNRYSIESMSSY